MTTIRCFPGEAGAAKEKATRQLLTKGGVICQQLKPLARAVHVIKLELVLGLDQINQPLDHRQQLHNKRDCAKRCQRPHNGHTQHDETFVGVSHIKLMDAEQPEDDR